MNESIKYPLHKIVFDSIPLFALILILVMEYGEISMTKYILWWVFVVLASAYHIDQYFINVIAGTDGNHIYINSRPYKIRKYEINNIKKAVVIKKLQANVFLRNLDGTPNYTETWYLLDIENNLIKIFIPDKVKEQVQSLFETIWGEIAVQVQQ